MSPKNVLLFLFHPLKFLFSNYPLSAFLCALCSCLLQALQSLSLADSRLRQRGTVLVNALGSNACLRKVDLSGNLLEDSGAKMLSKALQINTTLRCVYVCFGSAHFDVSKGGGVFLADQSTQKRIGGGKGETREVLKDR